MKRKNELKKLVRSVKDAVDRQGGARALGPLGSRHEGSPANVKTKVAAGGMTDQEARGAVLGDAVIQAVESSNKTTMQRLKAFLGEPREVINAAIGTVRGHVKAEQLKIKVGPEMTEEMVKRAQYSVSSNYARIISILDGMARRDDNGEALYDFSECESMADMISVARQDKTRTARGHKTMTAMNYKLWNDKTASLIDVKNFAADNPDSLAQVARLEAHIKRCLEVAVTANGKGALFALPILDMLALAVGNQGRKGSKLKLVHRKAA